MRKRPGCNLRPVQSRDRSVRLSPIHGLRWLRFQHVSVFTFQRWIPGSDCRTVPRAATAVRTARLSGALRPPPRSPQVLPSIFHRSSADFPGQRVRVDRFEFVWQNDNLSGCTARRNCDFCTCCVSNCKFRKFNRFIMSRG